MTKPHHTGHPPHITPPPVVRPRAGLFLTTALARLREVEALGPDWDTYGSPPPSPVALDRTRELLTLLAADSPPLPAVVPVPGGGVQLDWQHSPRGLELEVRPDGDLEFLQVDGDAMTEGPLDFARPDAVRDLVRWLGRGA